ncbi:MAG: bifunctional demethylmenaquinone methyltransferase/2-methoxy-6-polyprenyl-1,4-benzoquinol methylase [Pelagibacteraceae bacterium TMED216]|nr:MAG: bifunctional demethylmenaquinone methyltransferase/2-methoxy-6-polyprenyl-1,4-benzoquinol methylase [Pelagibacteraceae bacterium TMED216]|tara:strand:+ start:53 stop:757 length:705 start_codon:yes stop_codon:yes gene_type:complete
MKIYNQHKNKLVNSVFKKVSNNYDLMNDIMSFGVHRIWKNNLIEWMGPEKNSKLIDVASGTGDLAKLFSVKLKNTCEIDCVEPNLNMLENGKNKLRNYKNINWHKNPAEKLPFQDEIFDYYSISFGIRNVDNIELAMKEAYRVLKVGGRFFCLEFSKIENEILNSLYSKYSSILPKIGKIIVGDEAPYDYLVKSIENFYNQNELVNIMKKVGFSDVEFRNLSGGIAAIHMGWKV